MGITARSTLNNSWSAQITQNHSFFALIGLIRTLGYNEYVIQPTNSEGTLIALDLDRLNFLHAGDFSTLQLSICYFCKISEETYQLYRQLNGIRYSVGYTLKRALLLDTRPMNFEYSSIVKLTERVKTITKCFEECMAKYPTDTIIRSS